MSLSALARAPAPNPNAAHPWPQPQGPLLLATLIAIWYTLTSTEQKLLGLVGASIFSITEYIFYTVTIEEPNGNIRLRPFDKRCRKGHTTIHQFIANVLWVPLFIEGYMNIVPTSWLRIALFPFNIWLLELTQGYIFIYLYGVNPAWVYRGPEAFFHGTVNSGYFLYWLSMGFGVEYVAYPFLRPLLKAVVG